MFSETGASSSKSGAASTIVAQRPRQREVPLDHRAVAAAAVGAERRPHRERPRAPGHLRAGVPEVRARVVDRRQVRRAGRERLRQQRRVADEREAAVVRARSATCGRRRSTECARSTPSSRSPRRGVTRANSPNAPSTCSHAPCSSARSAARAIGSTSAAFGSPAVAATIAGAPCRSASARPSASTSIRPAPSRTNLPDLRAADAEHRERLRRAGVQVAARQDTGTGGSAARPTSSTSAPCRSPYQCRAAASAEKFARVAPDVRIPPQDAGRPNRSFSHVEREVSSRRCEGRVHPRERVLVEHARQPVGAERGRRHAAGDEVEHPRARRADGRGQPVAQQFGERRDGALALLGERPAEPLGGLGRTGREGRGRVQLRQEPDGLVGDERHHLVDRFEVVDRIGHASRS